MNARLMFARGMHPVHRWVFLTGALAYLSAPLWLGFLALSTWLLLAHANAEPQYFVMPHQLFPLWPSWRPEHAWALLAAIACVLFVPKILAALLAAARSASSYGGTLRLAISVLARNVDECVACTGAHAFSLLDLLPRLCSAGRFSGSRRRAPTNRRRSRRPCAGTGCRR